MGKVDERDERDEWQVRSPRCYPEPVIDVGGVELGGWGPEQGTIA